MMKLSRVVPNWSETSSRHADQAEETMDPQDATEDQPHALTMYDAAPPLKADVPFPFVDDLAMESWEPPIQLVEGMLTMTSTAALYGMPSTGKTTLALSLATAIGTGTEFFGRSTIQGSVVYVASEGRGGFPGRIRAAKVEANAGGLIGIYVVNDTVGLDSQHDALIQSIQGQLAIPPVLVVIDTLARSMLGLKENEQGDMGRVIRGADQIRDATGATVLLIHHTTKDGGAERGSGALRGALDTMMKVERSSSGLLTLTSDKSRDLPAFANIRFRIDEGDGGPVVRMVASGQLKATPPAGRGIPVKQLDALKALERLGIASVRSSEWKKVANMADSTFNAVAKRLVDAKLVAREQDKSSVYYSLLDKGRDALGG